MIEDGPDRRTLLKLMLAAGINIRQSAAQTAANSGLSDDLHNAQQDRAYWLQMMQHVAEPVLTAIEKRKLRELMPVEARPGTVEERRKSTHLEAVGRLLSGIAPWLEHGPHDGSESILRERFATAARAGLESGADPASPDYLRFGDTSQSLVDAAFLGLAILRAPNELWSKLTDQTRVNLARGLKAVRTVKPPDSNWLLFAAMVEVTLRFAGEQWEKERVDYAIRQHEAWYLGDGIYGDGPEFHWDYYNSFVIHPFLLQIFDRVADSDDHWLALRPKIETRALRYAAIQERLISPEGTYPAIGRSLAYRCGAFHLLADMSLREALPQGVTPQQVRSALTEVIRRSLGAPQTFDAHGWLTIGFCGHQPDMGETYISTGSLYLCSAVFLPLGLAPTNAFWAGPGAEWSARKAWSGKDFAADHALPNTTA
jgi:hypothetical protein